MQRFMHYVDKTRHDEMEREKQIEYMINEAVNEQWKKKDERKKMEKQARKILMDNVLQTRQGQIKDRGCKHSCTYVGSSRLEVFCRKTSLRLIRNLSIVHLKKKIIAIIVSSMTQYCKLCCCKWGNCVCEEHIHRSEIYVCYLNLFCQPKGLKALLSRNREQYSVCYYVFT